MKKIIDQSEAWQYLYEHPILTDEFGSSCFKDALHVRIYKVNPKTGDFDSNTKLNTMNKVELECGPYHRPEVAVRDRPNRPGWEIGYTSRDQLLNSDGQTFEQAIIKLANLVRKHYGDDRRKVKP